MATPKEPTAAKPRTGRSAETLWREAFDAVERPLASVSESWLQTDTFMDALAVSWRLQRRLTRRIERGTAAWLHLWGVPTRGDVTQLVNQVARLERQVRELARDQAEHR